eukprot:2879410-Pleurochrysis_carterae.AAC.1
MHQRHTQAPPEPAPEPILQSSGEHEPIPVQTVSVECAPAGAAKAAAASETVQVEANATGPSEKRSRKSSGASGRTSAGSLQIMLRQALEDIKVLKDKITRLEACVVSLESSSSASVGSSSTCHHSRRFIMSRNLNSNVMAPLFPCAVCKL